jgi:hypothetical protein
MHVYFDQRWINLCVRENLDLSLNLMNEYALRANFGICTPYRELSRMAGESFERTYPTLREKKDCL